ncbi:DNA-binding transcriptional regulator, XRE-family HTH domain [Micromonospora haikouensis]|uniref:DNA-binding transcriptional regulator, XRE-family HTH domain n=1 Tax=Micromonospora haikouensis TaxID=686309 RepID=A0A1C4VLH9_9ACTN|nr:helix-turn-helix transcriptional regulator [Micromonospora haikouensis]SCE84813.1 DNA-binding transcriptional regulator, XRE-family HTH domain [Micromonospora haikouensis]
MALRRHRLAQRRKTVGYTQESLAEKLGVDRTTVVRWERAESEPQPWARPRLADALRVSPDELSELFADVGPARTQRGDRLFAALKNPQTTDLAAVTHLRQELARLIDSYDASPSVAILPDASRLHSEVNLLRAHATGEAVRRALRGVEAAASIFMGQLVWDASQRRNAQAALNYYDQATHAAMQNNDAEAEAQARLRRGFIALYSEGDPKSGLAQAAQAAQLASRFGDHTLSAVALLHVGEANAMMGERSACERALSQAESHLARMDGDDRATDPTSAGQLNRLAGSCYLRLGEPKRAQSLLEGVPPGIQERRKSHAIVLGNLALAHLRQRDLDGATEMLHQVIDAIEETRGGGAVNVLFAASRELRPWRDRPDVQEVTDRTLALMSS